MTANEPYPFDPQAYGEEIASLLTPPRLHELGPGVPHEEARHALELMMGSPELLGGMKVVDAEMASCCRSALWLYHDFLDESHALSQEINTPSGSYWHGIMHRREPDADNAAYWFQRVGAHPIFPLLVDAAKFEAADYTGKRGHFLRTQTEWDPFRWIEVCDKARQKESKEQALYRRIALKEWELLFVHCFRRAITAM